MDAFTMPDDDDSPRGPLDGEALTRALAERLDEIVPRPLCVAALGDGLHVGLPPPSSGNGIGVIAEDANTGDGEGVEQGMLLHACGAALQQVQTWIIDNWLQEPWPVWRREPGKDPVPHDWAVIRGGEIHLGYGDSDDPALPLPPIALADVMVGPWQWREPRVD